MEFEIVRKKPSAPLTGVVRGYAGFSSNAAPLRRREAAQDSVPMQGVAA